MKTLALIAAATAVIATSTAASAHDYDRESRIDARRAEQAYRIRHDRRTGELTLLEKWRLQGEQRQIASMERRARTRRLCQPQRGARHRPGAGCRQPRHLPPGPRLAEGVVAAGVVGVVSDPLGLTPWPERLLELRCRTPSV